MASQFSDDGRYFAQISTDGKLKIWNTLSNSFEQEFTPDYHLTSPCSCLHFIQSDSLKYKGGSPKKKKRKDTDTNNNPKLALGTTSGVLLLYSINSASLECSINSETSLPLSCLSSVEQNIVYSGADQNVLVWDLEKKKIAKKWKAGNEKITAILAIQESNQVLIASKNIKLWDSDAKEVLRTFTGHKSEVMFLHYILPQPSGESYFISGSKGDRTLSCWSLSNPSSDKHAIANFLMEDIVHNISLNVASDGSTNMAATVRSGVVHIYRQTLNGKSSKPSKPKTTIQVVSDTGQTDDTISPIRIVGAIYRDDNTLCIGHGSEILLTFENIIPETNKKLQCFVRKDPHSAKHSKKDQVTKTITPEVNDNVQYLTSETSKITKTKRKHDGTLEVPMEKRLENLTLGTSEAGKAPTADSVARLMIQGLHSKDKKIMNTVLYQKNEEVIKNTVRKLPITALVPLLQELSSYIQGKTLSSQVGTVWLKYILETHSAVLMSNPELPELFGSFLGSIESRLNLLTPLNRLKGRLDLLLPLVSSSSKQVLENEKPLLVYNDKDSSDSESEEEIQMEAQSESGSEWEEESGDEKIGENHVDHNSEEESDAMSL